MPQPVANPPERKTFRDVVYLLLLSAFFLLVHLGTGSLASWDEAVYAQVAKELVASGNWFYLTWAGGPFVDKPPVAIWMTAAFYKLFGMSEFTARLFSALCGIGLVWVTYETGRKLLNRWTGLLGALVLLSSSHFFRVARFGMMDAPLAFFLSLTLLFFWRAREKDVYFLWAGAAASLGFLTKSYAALLAAPVALVYAVWAGEAAIFRRRAFWAGAGIVAATVALWNLYGLGVYGEPFVREAIFKHLFYRTTSALEGHTGNAYFYVRTIINKYHPWFLVALFSAPYFIYLSVRTRRKELLFLASWMWVIFGIVTLIRTKLAWYVVPVYPALSLSVGYVLAALVRERHGMLVKALFVGVMALHVQFSHLWSDDYARPVRGIAPQVAREVPAGRTVCLYNYHGQPEALFYFDRPVLYLDDPASLAAAAGEGGLYCLIFDEDLRRMEETVRPLGLKEKGAFESVRLYTT